MWFYPQSDSPHQLRGAVPQSERHSGVSPMMADDPKKEAESDAEARDEVQAADQNAALAGLVARL
jgi:hypothetical protein